MGRQLKPGAAGIRVRRAVDGIATRVAAAVEQTLDVPQAVADIARDVQQPPDGGPVGPRVLCGVLVHSKTAWGLSRLSEPSKAS